MAGADNRLRRAVNLGTLSAAPVNRSSNIGRSDLDDLYRFSLSQRSSLNLSLSSLARGANADLELYRLKRPLNDTLRQIGNLDFRKLGNKLKTYLQRVAASKRGKNQNEAISVSDLEAGIYFLRVLQRQGNSRYVLQTTATSEQPPDPGGRSVDTIAPTAILDARNASTVGGTTYNFTVTYSDDTAADLIKVANSNVFVTGPNDFRGQANRLAVNSNSNGTSYTVTYEMVAPGGTWTSLDNGIYSIALEANQVKNLNNSAATTHTLGTFEALIPDPSVPRSGGSGNSSPPGIDVKTEIALSRQDWNLDQNIGSFNGAGSKITLRFREEANGPITEITLANANIEASDLWESDIQAIDNLLAREEVIGSKSLKFNDLRLGKTVDGKDVNFDYSNGGVKYKVSFLNQPETLLMFFVPLPDRKASTRLTYINSLSELSKLSQIQGVVVGRNPLTNNLVSELYGIGRQSITLTTIPDDAIRNDLLY
ncbi:hypothetical protein [Leptolyngbya ohadii]|uniref:hypothetical protein n=1 Tax=Leptolyngbya ohadii TaxID=1962290 RepID=UPI000B59EAC8|nr:hypothetical protein [Leptolyngbya ohadii]